MRRVLQVALKSETSQLVFPPEEGDVYSSERTPKGLAPLGAKSGCGTIAEPKGDYAPMELGSGRVGP